MVTKSEDDMGNNIFYSSPKNRFKFRLAGLYLNIHNES